MLTECLLVSASNLVADDARTTVRLRVVQSRTVFVYGYQYQCPCQFLRALLKNLAAALNCS